MPRLPLRLSCLSPRLSPCRPWLLSCSTAAAAAAAQRLCLSRLQRFLSRLPRRLPPLLQCCRRVPLAPLPPRLLSRLTPLNLPSCCADRVASRVAPALLAKRFSTRLLCLPLCACRSTRFRACFPCFRACSRACHRACRRACCRACFHACRSACIACLAAAALATAVVVHSAARAAALAAAIAVLAAVIAARAGTRFNN